LTFIDNVTILYIIKPMTRR